MYIFLQNLSLKIFCERNYFLAYFRQDHDENFAEATNFYLANWNANFRDVTKVENFERKKADETFRRLVKNIIFDLATYALQRLLFRSSV